jgi:hypothetical protein
VRRFALPSPRLRGEARVPRPGQGSGGGPPLPARKCYAGISRWVKPTARAPTSPPISDFHLDARAKFGHSFSPERWITASSCVGSRRAFRQPGRLTKDAGLREGGLRWRF